MANGETVTNHTYLSTQRGRGGVDGSERPGGMVGNVAAQANAPPVQPPQDRSNSTPVVAAVDLARRHAIARAYALGIPMEGINAETGNQVAFRAKQ